MSNHAGIAIRHSAAANPIETRAFTALAEYLGAITGAPVTLSSDTLSNDSSDRIIIGQTPALQAQGLIAGADWPTAAEAYRITRTANDRGGYDGHIVGTDASGVQHGVYAYLEQLGCGFHLYGDVLPEPGGAFTGATFDIRRAPRFAMRGMQLWNYWYVGRDSWSYADFDAYLTQFPKLGLNVFDFPLYLYEPLFTGYRHEGHLIDGHMLAGIDTGLVRVGHQIFADCPRFVSPDIPDTAPQAERNAAAIALMRRVFARARDLGIRTSVDIELASLLHSNPALLETLPPEDRFDDGLMLSPASPTGKALLRTRIEALVAAYPDCDYYGIWQPEGVTMFESAGSPHPEDAAFRARHAHLADRLSPSDLDYVHSLLMAHAILQEIKPGAAIATGGWGADRIIAVADNILPPDIIRSTLGYYEPQLTLKNDRLANYGKTTGPKWHITWGEVDQHMWVMQPKTRTTATVLDQLEGHGVEAALLLHWRTLFSDLDISLFAKNCWTGTDRDSALDHWITGKFGSAAIAPLRQAINALEEFNLLVCDIDRIEQSIFWVGFDCGVGGILFGHRYVGNGAPLPEMWLEDGVRPNLTVNVPALAILKRAAAHSAAAIAATSGKARARLAYFDNHIRLSVALHESHIIVARAILAIEAGQKAGDERAGLENALALLAQTDPEGIVADFCRILGEGGAPDKGELGLLLSLNVKYIGGVRRLEGRIRRALGIEPPVLRPSPDSRLFVACAARAAPRSYEQAHDSSAIWTKPHSTGIDRTDAAPGFGLTVGDGLKVGRINPDTACWLQSGAIAFWITAPAGFAGRLRLYMYYEPDFDSAFCWQEVFVDGESLGLQRDYFCRGPYWDEGVWVERDISIGANVAPVEVRIVARGRLDARLSAVELIGHPPI